MKMNTTLDDVGFFVLFVFQKLTKTKEFGKRGEKLVLVPHQSNNHDPKKESRSKIGNIPIKDPTHNTPIPIILSL